MAWTSLIAGAGMVAPNLPGLPSTAQRKRQAQQPARCLGGHVAGQPPPRELRAQREGDADDGVEVGAADLAHEEDHSHHQEPGGGHGSSTRDRHPADRRHHAGPHADKNEEKGAEKLREQPAPFVRSVVKIPQPRRILATVDLRQEGLAEG